MISPRYHREKSQRYRLEAEKCKKCGKVSFPPRLICPKCKSKEFANVKLSDEGILKTFTVIRVASDTFSLQTPFAVGIVELKDSVRLTTQIAEPDFKKLKIGRKVKIVFRKIQDEGKSGLHCYGYKAVLI